MLLKRKHMFLKGKTSMTAMLSSRDDVIGRSLITC
jgi:hypothetical protein